MTTLTQLTALGGAIGSFYRPTASDLIFVEFSGNLSSLSIAPASIVASGSTTLRGTYTFNFDTGVQGGDFSNSDIFWEQQTEVLRQMVPTGRAAIANLGVTDFDAISALALKELSYSQTPINGNNDASNQLVDGTVFAVLTNAGHYAKVQVINYGYDLNIRWVTYAFGPRYRVLGSGYSQPEDVVVTEDGRFAYVTERTGNLLKVDLANGDRRSATLVSSGMTAPHQIALDEAANQAYVVEYAFPGRLLQIDLTTGSQTPFVTDLEGTIGLLVTRDRQFAYVSEQASTGGRIQRINLTTGEKEVIATSLVNPFMMTWVDSSETAFYITERDPSNRLLLVNLTTSPASVIAVATDVPFRPSSTAIVSPGRLLVCSDSVISEIDLALFDTSNLLMGIGFIPFNRIDAVSGSPTEGRADTTVDPTYFFQVKEAPFGGNLPLIINHKGAYDLGARFYQVLVDGVFRLDSWTDYQWNSSTATFELRTITPDLVTGRYPVRTPGEIWLNSQLGTLLNSTDLTNALHTLTIRYLDAAGTLVVDSNQIVILVNNKSCIAKLELPTVDGNPADPTCGYLKYPGTGSTVKMKYTANHPDGFATYSFKVIRGVNNIVSLGGNVPAPGEYSDTVANFLSSCTVAGLSEYLYVAANITNGWGRQSQYDASGAIALALAP
jgi:hypothetical protein